MSKRPPSFAVTAAGQKVNLDAAGTAQASFTVTNTSAQALKGRLLTRLSDPAKPEWFSIVGESVRDFAPNASEQVVVQVTVPPGSPLGSYSFRLDAVSEVDPDEDFTEGPSVAFEVTAPPPPKKKFPWWILAIVGAVVLLIIIGVVAWLLLRDDGSKSATVPAVVGQPTTVAQSTLTGAGFTSTVTNVGVADPQQDGIVQSQDPTAGTSKEPGTVVTIAVGRNVPVPNVVGFDQRNAQVVLSEAGLKPRVVRVHVRVPILIGIVQSQSPPALTGRAQTRVPLGSVVTIRVNVSP